MKNSALIVCSIVAIALFGLESGGRAEEWIHLDPQQWEATLEFDGFRRQANSGETTDIEFQEGIRVRQRGFGLDRRIATFSLDTHFVLEQGRRRSPSGESDRTGKFVDYVADMSVLHGTPSPVSVNGQATRSSGTLDGSLGSRSEFVSETRSAAINWKSPHFPSSLRYTERLLDSTFDSGTGSTSQRDDALRTIGLSGRSSKLDLALEHAWFTDRVSVTETDYDETRARVAHNFRWGKGSNLNSRIRFTDRTGFRPRQRFHLNESARLRHSSKLESVYRYRFESLSLETDTETHAGSVGVRHLLYKNLTTNLKLTGSTVDADASEEDKFDGRADFAYSRTVIWGGKLTAALGGGYGQTRRVSKQSSQSVIDEHHQVPASEIVVLSRRFIDTATIVVTDQAGNVRYSEGTDYTVAATGDLTELRIVSGQGIGVGQTIIVDYEFQTLPSLTFSRLPYNVRAALDFGWISFFHRISGEKQSLISGQNAGSLRDRQDRTTGLELRWERPDATATFGAEKRSISLGDFSSNTLTFRQSLVHSGLPRATLSANANESFITSGNRDIELFRADISLDWRPTWGLFVKPFASAWFRRDKAVPEDGLDEKEDRFFRMGVNLRWRVRQIRLNMRYNHDIRITDTDKTIEDRLMLTVTRKF